MWTLIDDLRYVVCVLAFGMAATITAFSLLNAVVFRPLPVPEFRRRR